MKPKQIFPMSALALITQRYSNSPAQSTPVDPVAKTGQGPGKDVKPFGDDGLSFGDLIDIINPLQHIPVLGTIYRKISGDAIDPAARVAGGALFGGPLGAAMAVVGAVFENMIDDKEPTAIPDRIEELPTAYDKVAAVQTPVSPVSPVSNPEASYITNLGIKHEPHDDVSSQGARVKIRGGWIVNAAYEGKSSALFGWARNPASEYAVQLQAGINNSDEPPVVSVNI